MCYYTEEEARRFADDRKAEIASNLLAMAGFDVVDVWADAWNPEDDIILYELHVTVREKYDWRQKQCQEAAEALLRAAPILFGYGPNVEVVAA